MFSGSDCWLVVSLGRLVEFDHRGVGAAAADDFPFVVLVDQYGADEVDRCGVVGSITGKESDEINSSPLPQLDIARVPARNSGRKTLKCEDICSRNVRW